MIIIIIISSYTSGTYDRHYWYSITLLLTMAMQRIIWIAASRIHISEAVKSELDKFTGYITDKRGETFVKVSICCQTIIVIILYSKL